MKSYLDIVKLVLDNGIRQENRTGIDTLAVPNVHFSHDMGEGFPLLTTRRAPFKNIKIELEGFIKGITSKKWYRDRGCNFWNFWCNPNKTAEKIKKFVDNAQPGERDPGIDRIKQWQLEEDDLGPLGYSHGWRRFNKAYDENDGGWIEGYEEKADQLKTIVNKLHTNPNDRRLVCSAWNPLHNNKAALPPCHLMFCVTVISDKINLHWSQRSCDLLCGVSANIASYALLLELLTIEINNGEYAKKNNIKYVAGNLSGMLCNCHIYENHIAGATEQVLREPRKLPLVQIKHDNFNIFDWTHEDVELIDYNPHPRIKFEVAI